ncbi:MAG: prepilin-type N-terminal cleavage/methylation domain-containing protein [Clostridiales bacterium]|nr:prepilin-type N-terminal cleavage/methylation domain-containing protein [Clostridiales bacterium]
MKKIAKNKKGFSLTEIILVVAIIVILASAVLVGVNEYLDTANAAESNVDASVEALTDNITAKENDLKNKGF